MKHNDITSRTADTMKTRALVELATKIALRMMGPRNVTIVIVAFSKPSRDPEAYIGNNKTIP